MRCSRQHQKQEGYWGRLKGLSSKKTLRMETTGVEVFPSYPCLYTAFTAAVSDKCSDVKPAGNMLLLSIHMCGDERGNGNVQLPRTWAGTQFPACFHGWNFPHLYVVALYSKTRQTWWVWNRTGKREATKKDVWSCRNVKKTHGASSPS